MTSEGAVAANIDIVVGMLAEARKCVRILVSGEGGFRIGITPCFNHYDLPRGNIGGRSPADGRICYCDIAHLQCRSGLARLHLCLKINRRPWGLASKGAVSSDVCGIFCTFREVIHGVCSSGHCLWRTCRCRLTGFYYDHFPARLVGGCIPCDGCARDGDIARCNIGLGIASLHSRSECLRCPFAVAA